VAQLELSCFEIESLKFLPSWKVREYLLLLLFGDPILNIEICQFYCWKETRHSENSNEKKYYYHIYYFETEILTVSQTNTKCNKSRHYKTKSYSTQIPFLVPFLGRMDRCVFPEPFQGHPG
jgi:hypothetical protein